MAREEPTPGAEDAKTRTTIAFTVVALSVIGIAVVSAVAMIWASDERRPETARLVFSSILPLLGTWVGTVLAFYFARENLEAATTSTLRLSSGLRAETPVTEAMIPRADIIAIELGPGESADDLRLADIAAKMAPGRARVPILNDRDAVVYVVHESTLTKFAASATPPKQVSQLTEKMSDLLNDPDLAAAVKAIAVVGPDANLAAARAAMKAVEHCNDVFVTSRGRRDDPVLGWLTNTDLAAIS